MYGKPPACLVRAKRSSSAAATRLPSRSSTAADSVIVARPNRYTPHALPGVPVVAPGAGKVMADSSVRTQ